MGAAEAVANAEALGIDIDEQYQPVAPAHIDPDSIVRPSMNLATKDTEGWNYSELAKTDIDGDGRDEELWVIAQVEMDAGRPLWQDGQEWQVYVKDGDEVHHLFADSVQLGRLDVAVSAEEPHAILIRASSPPHARLYEILFQNDELTVYSLMDRKIVARPSPTGDQPRPDLRNEPSEQPVYEKGMKASAEQDAQGEAANADDKASDQKSASRRGTTARAE